VGEFDGIADGKVDGASDGAIVSSVVGLRASLEDGRVGRLDGRGVGSLVGLLVGGLPKVGLFVGELSFICNCLRRLSTGVGATTTAPVLGDGSHWPTWSQIRMRKAIKDIGSLERQFTRTNRPVPLPDEEKALLIQSCLSGPFSRHEILILLISQLDLVSSL
jgi:hypothetical protein